MSFLPSVFRELSHFFLVSREYLSKLLLIFLDSFGLLVFVFFFSIFILFIQLQELFPVPSIFPPSPSVLVSLSCSLQEAHAMQEKVSAQYKNEIDMAKAQRDYELKKAAYDIEVNTKKAESEMAYQLQVHMSIVFISIY